MQSNEVPMQSKINKEIKRSRISYIGPSELMDTVINFFLSEKKKKWSLFLSAYNSVGLMTALTNRR